MHHWCFLHAVISWSSQSQSVTLFPFCQSGSLVVPPRWTFLWNGNQRPAAGSFIAVHCYCRRTTMSRSRSERKLCWSLISVTFHQLSAHTLPGAFPVDQLQICYVMYTSFFLVLRLLLSIQSNMYIEIFSCGWTCSCRLFSGQLYRLNLNV